MNNDETRTRHSVRAMAPFAFLLPAAVLVVIALISGIYPFGNATLLCDANREFINGLETFGSTSAGGSLYSFAEGLGSGHWSVLTAMFSNPLCMLGFLFPQGRSADAFLLITMLKMSLSGFFCYLMTTRLNDRSELCLGLSTAYGGCAGFIIGAFTPAAMDAFILVPAVGAGILTLLKNGKTGGLFVALTAIMITSWQLLPAILLFTVGFFAWSTVAGGHEKAPSEAAKKLLLCLLFAVGTASFVMIPSLLERGDTGSAIRALNDVPSVSFVRMLSGLFMGSRLTPGGNAVLFCSACTLLTLPIYTFNSEMPRGERMLGTGMLLLLLLSECLSALGILFTALQLPAAFESGVSFLFCATATAAAARGLSMPGGITVGKAVGSWFISGLLFVISLLSGGKPNVLVILFTVGFLTLYAAVVLVVMSSDKTPAVFGVVIMVCIFAEACASGVFRMNDLKDQHAVAVRESYAAASGSEQAINALLIGKEKTEGREGVFRVRGETALLSSADLVNENCADRNSPEVFSLLGIDGNKGWTAVTDSLFGVRYTLSPRKTDDYEPITEEEGLFISENPDALNIGVASSELVSGIDLTRCSTPFTAQELFVSAVIGEQRTLFVPAEAECTAEGANFVTSGGGVFITRFKNLATLNYSMTATTNGMMYMWMDTSLPDETPVYVNGQLLEDTSLSALVELGHFSAGETVEVSLRLSGVSESVTAYRFAALDDAALRSALDYLSARQLSFVKRDGNLVSGVVDAQEGELLLTTIPYSEGWTAYIDGDKADISACVGNLMAVETPAGQHTVSLVYQPRGFTVCASASLLCLIAGVCWAVIEARKIKKENEGVIPEVDMPLPLSGEMTGYSEAYNADFGSDFGTEFSDDFGDEDVTPVSNVTLQVDLDYESDENTLNWL